MPYGSYSGGHSSYDEKECEEEKDCDTMNSSPSSIESFIPSPLNDEADSSPLSMTDSDDSLPPPPPNDNKFCFSSPSTIDSEESLPPPPPPDECSSSSSVVESNLSSSSSSVVESNLSPSRQNDDMSNSTGEKSLPSSSVESGLSPSSRVDTCPLRADHTISRESEHSVVLSQHSYSNDDERTSFGSNAGKATIEEESRAGDQANAELQSNEIVNEDVNQSSDIDELPDSIRFDYSSLSFSSHSSLASSTNLPQQLSSQQRLDPPERPDLERQTKVALQTCFTILQTFALRCNFDHWRKGLLVANCEEDILSCCTSISRLSSDSILSLYNNESTLKIEELQSKRLVFTTLQSRVQQKKTISKALDMLDKLSQNITLRNALTKWVTINKHISAKTILIQARNDRLLKTVFGCWREKTRRELAKRQSLWLMMVFNRWRMLVDENKEEKEKDLVALLHWANNLTAKAFSALRMYAKESKRLNKHVGFSFGHQRFVSPSSSGKYLSNSRESSFISYRSPKPSMIFNRSPGSNRLGRSSYSSGGNYDVSRLNNMTSNTGDISQRLANMTSRTGDRSRFNNDITKSRTVDVSRFSPFLRASSSSISSPSSRNGGVLKVNRSFGKTIEQQADQITHAEQRPQTVIQRPSVTFSDHNPQTRQAPETATVSNGRDREYNNLSYRAHDTTLASQIQRPGSQFTSTRPNYQTRGDRQANSSPQFPWDET